VGQSKGFQISRWGSSRGFFSKKIPPKKFSTNEPISTNIIPIDSAQEAEKTQNRQKISPDPNLVEQLGNFREKTP
jgi:hypothetical protein